MLRQRIARLYQLDHRNGSRLFDLFDNHVLHVRHHLRNDNAAYRLRYAVDVAILNPQPHLIHHYSWRWLKAAAATALIMVITGLPGLLGNLRHLGETLLSVAALAFWLTVLFLFLFYRQSRSAVIFQGRYTETPLVEIAVNHPDRESYAHFIETLSHSIALDVKRNGYGRSDLIRNELKSLAKLARQQVIDLETYEAAKASLSSQ